MPPVSRRLAVVVGINAYSQGVPALTSAVHDARAVAAVLAEAQGYEVTLLLDGEATLAGIRAALLRTVEAARGHDRVIFYFAGHGIAEDAGPEGDGPRGYFLPHDASASRSESFLAMDEVRATLARPNVHHLLLLLDCCFAGTFQWTNTRDSGPRRRGGRLYRERYDRYLREPAWQVLASSAHDERALDVVAGKVLGARAADHSPFAQACIAGLRGAADLAVGAAAGDGIVLASELYLFIEEAFQQHEQATGRPQQTPSLSAFGGPQRTKGQFVFERTGADPGQLPSAAALTEANNPYRGLTPYAEANAGLFFGREAATRALALVVCGQALTVLVGASGTGKSSLVAAGLLPRLRASTGPAYRVLATQRPERAPMAALARIVAELGSAAGTSLADAVAAALAREPGVHLVVIVDQLEELVTQTFDAGVRAEFLAALAAAAERGGERLHIVATLRLDFEAHFAGLLAPRGGRSPRFLIPHMSREELRQIVEGPASERVLFFDAPELVDALVDEVIDAPGALPLLSFTLSEMFRVYVRMARDDRTLRREDYDSLGGVSGALARRADELYAGLGEAERATLRRMALRMVVPGESARRPVLAAELIYADESENGRVQVIWARLVEARLVSAGQDALGRGFIEPAHDKLVTGWPRLRTFLDEERETFPLVYALGQAAAQWDAGGRASGLLWDDDPRRPQAVALLGERPERFNAVERAFIEGSRRRHRRGWISLVVAVSVVVISLTAITAYALRKRGQAEDARDQAEKRKVAAQVARDEANARLHDLYLDQGRRHVLAGDLARALPFLAEVYRARPDDVEVRWDVALATEMVASHRALAGHAGAVTRAVFLADGVRLLTTAAEDPAPRIWDTNGKEPVRVLTGLTAPVVAAMPLGDSVMAVARDGAVAVWGADGAAPVRTFSHCPADEACTVYAADTDFHCRLVTLGEYAVYLWDACDGVKITEHPVDGMRMQGDEVSISRPGDRIATAGGQLWAVEEARGKARLRELARMGTSSHPRRFVFRTNNSEVLAIESSSEGPEGFVPEDGRQQNRYHGHIGGVVSAAYTADDQVLVTTSFDNTARLWFGAGESRILYGHDGPVVDARFTANGARLVTASSDGTARVWRVEPSGNNRGSSHLRPVAALVLDSGAALTAAAVAPAGERIAVGDTKGAVHLWQGGRRPRALPGLAEGMRAFQGQFSGDGGRLLIGGRSMMANDDLPAGVVVLVERATGQVELQFDEPGLVVAGFTAADATVATVVCAGQPTCVLRRRDARTGESRGEQALVGTRAESAYRGVNTAAFSGDGELLALISAPEGSSADGGVNRAGATLGIWRTRDGQAVATIREVGDVSHLAWHPRGAAVIGYDSNTAYVWSAEDGALRRKLPEQDFSDQIGEKIVWWPDGVHAFVASGGRMSVWDTNTGALRPGGVAEELNSIAVARGGPLALGIAGYMGLVVFDAGGERSFGRLLTDGADSVVLSPDGQWAVTLGWGAAAGSLGLWDLRLEARTSEEVAAIAGCHDPFRLVDGVLARVGEDPSRCAADD